MSAADLLRRIARILDDAGIPSMIAGSFASTFHGVPRTTHDIDIVIDPSPATLERLLSELPDADYYVDADVARDALRTRGRFNVIDLATGWKVDFIVRKLRDFSAEELARRQRVTLLGADVHVASVEDTVIAKLEWAKLGASERQLRDVVGLVQLHGERLDRAYVERWVDALELRAEWERVLADINVS